MYKMKFSPETLKILRNFQGINPGILFRPGNILATISPSSQSVFARVKVNETFESEFGIFDLSTLLSILKIYSDPDIEIYEKYLKIVEGGKSSLYGFSSASMVIAPVKGILQAEPDYNTSVCNFNLKTEDLKFINNLVITSSGLNDRAFIADGKHLVLKAYDSTNSESNFHDIIIGDTEQTFELIFKSENMKLIEGEYQVGIFKEKRVAGFKGPVEYFIKCEAKSVI